jgi:aminomethyltransferase
MVMPVEEMMSDETATPTLRRTPLYGEHVALGARMVDFSGWEMPVQYSGIVDEHRAVRMAAGIFDVSHMGEFIVTGKNALEYLQGLVPNNVARLEEGQALYTQICNEHGGTLDDLLIYHLAPERYMVVVNAGTLEKDWAWFSQHAAGRDDLTLTNLSDATALIALQGPRALEILRGLANIAPSDVIYYHAQEAKVAGIDCLISRTGYTGEDGFELYHATDHATDLWRALLDAGRPLGLLPAGLGARDTLRLEAGLCLYGHELTDDITPYEAELGWSIKLKKGMDFIGREALAKQKFDGLSRVRVGLKLLERAVARADSPIWHHDQQVGMLTSGTMSLTLSYPIGMGYIPPEIAVPGTVVFVELRGKRIPAEIVSLPFYRRDAAK